MSKIKKYEIEKDKEGMLRFYRTPSYYRTKDKKTVKQWFLKILKRLKKGH